MTKRELTTITTLALSAEFRPSWDRAYETGLLIHSGKKYHTAADLANVLFWQIHYIGGGIDSAELDNTLAWYKRERLIVVG